MSNLILTTDCQRKCSYCFAGDDRDKGLLFSWESFIKVVNFFPPAINLLGGEPTLHPEFIRMLDYLLVNNFTIQVFTNGLLSDDLLIELVNTINKYELKKDQLYFAVNVSSEKYRTKDETIKQIKFFKALTKLAYPSFTIYEKDTNLLFLLDLIKKYDLDPTIRLGIAMPVIGGSNIHLPAKLYKNVAQSIINLSENSDNATIVFDCGFPLCMFTLEEISRLNKNEKNDFMFSCGQPLDIYPDLTVANCYPLSKLHKVSLNNFKTFNELNNYFRDGFSTPTGIYGDRCKECTFFKKICDGGCKGFYTPQKGVLGNK